MAFTKTACPITRNQFAAKAPSVQASIAGTAVVMAPRTFSTGSLGWNASQKVVVMIDGKPVACQLGLNLTVVGSKELNPEQYTPVGFGGHPQDSDESIKAACGTPEVQAILKAQKEKRDREEAEYAATNGKAS